MTTPLLKLLASVVILAVIGAVALVMQQPLLVPSLGSATFVQVFTPQAPAARIWNTAAGQVLGLLAGLAAVLAAGATAMPPFMGHHPLVAPRLVAVVIATLLTAALQLGCQAINPAGGATALVVALGAETATWAGAARMIAGIVLVTALGEVARRVILRTTEAIPRHGHSVPS